MFNSEFDKLLDFFLQNKLGGLSGLSEQLKDAKFYGYTFTTGADGKPIFKEFGNREDFGIELPHDRTQKKNMIDEIETNNEIKYVLEMAGLQKEDIKIRIMDDMVLIEGARGKRQYNEKIFLKHVVEQPKATYTNGILELTFKKSEPTVYDVSVE